MLTLDHIRPESKGGTYRYENLTPACYNCNTCKKDLSIEEFRDTITAYLDPKFIKLNHKTRRAIKRGNLPLNKIKRYGRKWESLLSNFTVPVTFYFEKTKGVVEAPEPVAIATQTKPLPIRPGWGSHDFGLD